ncbi:MAG: nitrile hydratase subunit beta [Alphaproteobacteria bacterium]|nr:nitrile hydratase subunit beta [Alphaproteobacteria bacterium]
MTDRAITDLGGLEAGPVDTHEHEPTLTERRIDAMMMLMRQKPRAFWGADENRRTIESLTPEMYENSKYYERWVWAMRALTVEKGILSEAEIEARLADVRQRYAAKGDPS